MTGKIITRREISRPKELTPSEEEVLKKLASRIWSELYQLRLPVYSRLEECLKKAPYFFTPSWLELNLLARRGVWEYFTRGLMEGTVVSDLVRYKGKWQGTVEYLEDYPLPRHPLARHYYLQLMPERMMISIRETRIRTLVETLRNCSPSGIEGREGGATSSNIILPKRDDLLLLDEILRKKDYYNLFLLKGFSKLTKEKWWVNWEGDKRRPPSKFYLWICCWR